jgi:stringent starvation protein B
MSSAQPPRAKPPSKKEMLTSLLAEGMTMLHLDARAHGVDVPAAHQGNPHLRLNLSPRFGRPLRVLEDRVEAELTFGGRAHACVVPLAAVFGMSSHQTGKTLLWPEDIPPEVLKDLEEPPPPAPVKPRLSRPAVRKRPSHLKLAPPPGEDEEDGHGEETDPPGDTAAGPPPPPPTPPTPPRRGHLRLVK